MVRVLLYSALDCFATLFVQGHQASRYDGLTAGGWFQRGDTIDDI